MGVAALIVYLAGGLLAGVLRVVVQVRRTGDSGIRAGGVRVRVALLGLCGMLLSAAAAVADIAGLNPVVEQPVVQYGGTILGALGVVATLGAQLAMGDAWRIGVDTDERTELVTGGVFGVVRNPIYTGMLLTVTGVTAMVPNALSLVGLVLVIVAVELQVRVIEEPHLRRVHGDAYARYAASVGRFVPWIGRG